MFKSNQRELRSFLAQVLPLNQQKQVKGGNGTEATTGTDTTTAIVVEDFLET